MQCALCLQALNKIGSQHNIISRSATSATTIHHEAVKAVQTGAFWNLLNWFGKQGSLRPRSCSRLFCVVHTLNQPYIQANKGTAEKITACFFFKASLMLQ